MFVYINDHYFLTIILLRSCRFFIYFFFCSVGVSVTRWWNKKKPIFSKKFPKVILHKRSVVKGINFHIEKNLARAYRDAKCVSVWR